MKRKIMAALVAFFIFSTPVAVLAQEDEPAKEPDSTVAVQADEVPVFEWSDLLAIGVWISVIISTWSIWSLSVSKVLVDKGIKEFVKPILARFSEQDELSRVIRVIVIHSAVAVAAYFTVGVFDYNVFSNAPDVIVSQIPNVTLQSLLTAGWLATGAFLLHSASKWFAPDEPAPSVAT